MLLLLRNRMVWQIGMKKSKRQEISSPYSFLLLVFNFYFLALNPQYPIQILHAFGGSFLDVCDTRYAHFHISGVN